MQWIARDETLFSLNYNLLNHKLILNVFEKWTTVIMNESFQYT